MEAGVGGLWLPGIVPHCSQTRLHAFRHIASTEDHVNVRGNGAIASIMRIFDLVSGEQTFTDSDLYRHVSSWMDEMISDDGLAYGCMRHGSRYRYGLGSPPQYMQLWWILGGFMI